MKNFLMVTALSLASLSLLSAKSYEIVLTAPTQAGNVKLAAGHYMVKLNGSNANFVNIDNSKSVSVPVKVENAKSKFGYTAVDTKTQNGVDQIQSIELRDTNSILQF